MALRYLGFFHYGLSASSDAESVLGPTILDLGDIDRMQPELSDPPPTHEELRAARERVLAERQP